MPIGDGECVSFTLEDLLGLRHGDRCACLHMLLPWWQLLRDLRHVDVHCALTAHPAEVWVVERCSRLNGDHKGTTKRRPQARGRRPTSACALRDRRNAGKCRIAASANDRMSTLPRFSQFALNRLLRCYAGKRPALR